MSRRMLHRSRPCDRRWQHRSLLNIELRIGIFESTIARGQRGNKERDQADCIALWGGRNDH